MTEFSVGLIEARIALASQRIEVFLLQLGILEVVLSRLSIQLAPLEVSAC